MISALGDFRPVVEIIDPLDDSIIEIGAVVPINVIVNDEDTPGYDLTTEFYWSNTGLIGDVVLLGSTLPTVITGTITSVVSELAMLALGSIVGDVVSRGDLNGDYYFCQAIPSNDADNWSAVYNTRQSIQWDTATVTPGKPGKLFVRASDGVFGNYAEAVVTLNAPPSGITILTPSEGQRVNSNTLINMTWNAATDPDDLSSEIRYLIEYSLNGGTSYNYVPGVPFTEPGATSYSFDPEPYPVISALRLRIRASDGYSYGPPSTVGVSFKPVATDIDAPVGGVITVGTVVTLDCTVADQDTSLSQVFVEYYYSVTGLFADRISIGTTAPGITSIDWDTTGYPSNKTGAAAIFVIPVDDIGAGDPFSIGGIILNVLPTASNLNFTQKANTFNTHSITFYDPDDLISVVRHESRPAHVPMDETFDVPSGTVNVFFSVDANVAEIGIHTWQYRVDGDSLSPHYFTATLEILAADPEQTNIFDRFYVPQHHPGAIR